MFVIFSLCLVSIAVAHPPRPHTSQPQWKANIIDVDEQEKLIVRGGLSYDAIDHRERLCII